MKYIKKLAGEIPAFSFAFYKLSDNTLGTESKHHKSAYLSQTIYTQFKTGNNEGTAKGTAQTLVNTGLVVI